MDSAKSILVTGGAGFIGSHLVERLLQEGSRVVVVDDLSTGKRSNLDAASGIASGQLEIIEGRVSDVLPGMNPEDFAASYHLAAAVGVRLVLEAPIHTIENNVHETSAALEFARRGNVPTLIASTSEVYGKGFGAPFSEDDDVVYGPTTCARWSYACSKAIDEYLALAHAKEGLAPTVIVRFFNTVGPRQVGEYGMVLPRFVQAAMEGAPLEVYGDGLQSRCFCDVRDVVPAIIALLGRPDAYGRVYNIGSAQPITIMALAERVRSRLGSDSDIVCVPYAEAFDGELDDLRAREPDLTRIREILDFTPGIPLDTTIDDLAAEWAVGRSRS